METVEYRVRPVERYIVTRFSSVDEASGTVKAGCECLGEFDNPDKAVRAKEAFEAADAAKVRMSSFAIVQRGVEPATQVYYSNTLEEARSFKEQFERLHGGEWRIYAPLAASPCGAD